MEKKKRKNRKGLKGGATQGADHRNKWGKNDF